MELGKACVSSAHRTLVYFGQLRVRYVSVKKAVPETIEKDVRRTLVLLWVFFFKCCFFIPVVVGETSD